MSRNPSKLVLAMAVLLAVWVAVFWIYKPRLSEANGAGGGISYGQPPDLARALVSTDPVMQRKDPADVSKPLPVANLPGQGEPMPAPVFPAPQGGKRLVPPEFSEYTVQKGDSSFGAISKRIYGTSKHGEAISRANPFVTPDKLVAGKTKLRIPKDPTNIQGKVEETPGAIPPAPQPQADAPGGETLHTVQPGETLGAISKRYYGTTTRWKAILEANTSLLDKPEKLRAGMTLHIPPKD